MHRKMREKQNDRKNVERELVEIIRKEQEPTAKQKLFLLYKMSIPSILSQITSIVMQYIDAAMVGNLGAGASASIGVVSTSTWLLSGLCSAVSTGFSVQSALTGVFISGNLPIWLKADLSIRKQASSYFLVYACSLPFVQLNSMCSSMLQSSGNMKTPSILNASMCLLDVFFNWIFIRYLGVMGAALEKENLQGVSQIWRFCQELLLWDLQGA